MKEEQLKQQLNPLWLTPTQQQTKGNLQKSVIKEFFVELVGKSCGFCENLEVYKGLLDFQSTHLLRNLIMLKWMIRLDLKNVIENLLGFFVIINTCFSVRQERSFSLQFSIQKSQIANMILKYMWTLIPCKRECAMHKFWVVPEGVIII